MKRKYRIGLLHNNEVTEHSITNIQIMAPGGKIIIRHSRPYFTYLWVYGTDYPEIWTL
jgi:hypothetical protein